MFKRILSLILCLVMILTIATGCQSKAPDAASAPQSNTPAATVDPIKVAIVNPMSGASSDCGRMTKDGAELFKKVFNEAGGVKSLGGAEIEIDYFDCTSDPAQTKTVMERALSSGKYIAVVGNGTSALTLPSLPAVEKARVPLVTYSNSKDLNNQGYKYVFSLSPTAAAIGGANAEFLQELKEVKGIEKNKVAILYENSSWGTPVAEGSLKKCESMGLEIVLYESFPNNMPDASALVTKTMNSGAEIIMMTAYANDSKLIIDTMHSMDYYPLMIGGGSWQSFADGMGEGVLGVLTTPNTVSTTSTITENPKYSGLDKIHRELFGYQFAVQGVMTYSCLELITNVLEGTPTRDPIELRDAIAAYNGPTIMQPGTVYFDETGVAVGPIAPVCQWQSVDELVCIWPEEIASGEYMDPADFVK